MFDYSCNCDLRTQLEQAQANLWCTLLTQHILMSPQATCAVVDQQHTPPPAWVHAAHVYQPTNQCRCDDYSSFRQRRTNCKNCGAPLTHGNLCVYCDTNNV